MDLPMSLDFVRIGGNVPRLTFTNNQLVLLPVALSRVHISLVNHSNLLPCRTRLEEEEESTR
jgi:hypothetical protein